MPSRLGPPSKKSIYDPVHGMITLEGAAVPLIGHPAFQRLWGIRQTGFAHLVFPGANHTRLEHSLGVYWAARKMAEALRLDPTASKTVSLGGLLHDLGHPPFSHTLEPTMREVLGRGHEAASRGWILGNPGATTAIAESPAIPAILERFGVSPKSVADLVDPPVKVPPGRALLRAMLHGPIDSDRIDYLQRDAHYTGVGHGSIDAIRLLDTVRAETGRLVFAEKGRSAVEGFLVGRALMYASVYYHKTVRAAEVMAQGAVERLPGYPESARDLFEGTDGDLLVALREAGGISERLVQSLLARRLYKRAFALRNLNSAQRRHWLGFARSPANRREFEDELAAEMGAPSGSVLLDLAGLEPRLTPTSDWAEVAVYEGQKVVHPFAGPGAWRELAVRPPTPWAISFYTEAKLRTTMARRLTRRAGESF